MSIPPASFKTFGRRGTLAIAALLIPAMTAAALTSFELALAIFGVATICLCITIPTWVHGSQQAARAMTPLTPEIPSVQSATTNNGSGIAAFLSLAFLLAMGWFYVGGGLQRVASSNMKDIAVQVATNSVDEYNITRRHGDPLEICVHAGLVVAAYLQGKDEINYAHWKTLEKRDCSAAGISR